MERTSFPVSGTMCRGGGFAPFASSKNNLNPSLVASDEGLHIKIMTTTLIPWDEVESVVLRQGLGTKFVVLKCGKWDYIAHFRNQDGLKSLLAVLQERQVQGAQEALDGKVMSSAQAMQSSPLRFVVIGVAIFMAAGMALNLVALAVIMCSGFVSGVLASTP